jgi:hypothetical protein
MLLMHSSYILPKRQIEADGPSNSITNSPKGWTDREIGVNFIKIYDRDTAYTAPNGERRVLFLDGHSSHYSLELLRYTMRPDVNIQVLGYPPHCTHVLQGLDVACFAHLKDVYKRQVKRFEEMRPGVTVGPGEFAEVFGGAWLKAMTANLVKSGWKATGLIPYNEGAITASQMRPSEATSIQGSFPQVLPSPVLRVVRVLRDVVPLDFDVDSDASRPASPDLAGPSRHAAAIPRTPTKRPAPIEATLDETPSKRSRLLVDALRSSKTTSFLVHKNPLTSAHALAPSIIQKPLGEERAPDWSLLSLPTPSTHHGLRDRFKAMKSSLSLAKAHVGARDIIIEGAHAQLALGDALGARQRQALFLKENKPKTDPLKVNLFANGLGRVLSDSEVIRVFEAKETELKAAAALKSTRKDAKETRKQENEAFAERWRQLKALRADEVAEWQRRCEQLDEDDVPKKDWPLKPRAPRKAELMQTMSDEDISADLQGGMQGDVVRDDNDSDDEFEA